VQAFGIAVRDGAEVDLIRNAIKSGPNAGSTTVVLTWGILLVGPDSGGSRVHHNSIWRVANGIHTLSGSDGAVISYNHVTTSTFGILVEGTGGDVHHNHVHNNFISIWANAVGNDFHDNNAHDSTVLDCSDDTIGTGTAGTGNTWTNNIGANAIPDAICDPET